MAEDNHMELRTADDCIKDSYLQSYINKVLVLNPKSLNEAYRHGEFQYFLGLFSLCQFFNVVLNGSLKLMRKRLFPSRRNPWDCR